MVKLWWKPTQPSSTSFQHQNSEGCIRTFLLSKISNPIFTPTSHHYYWGVQMQESEREFELISNALSVASCLQPSETLSWLSVKLVQKCTLLCPIKLLSRPLSDGYLWDLSAFKCDCKHLACILHYSMTKSRCNINNMDHLKNKRNDGYYTGFCLNSLNNKEFTSHSVLIRIDSWRKRFHRYLWSNHYLLTQ